jgi:putative ABC transport system substrate-binding protein
MLNMRHTDPTQVCRSRWSLQGAGEGPMVEMRRREVIGFLGWAAVAWPLGARAQQAERVRRIGMLSPLAKNDPNSTATVAALLRGLDALGWTVGRNIQIDYRFADGDAGKIQKFASELVELKPELIIGRSTPVVKALQQATKTIPIIFTQVTDAERQGFVSSLSHPGGNVTGFIHFEPAIGSKWLESLKDIMPNIERVAVIYNPTAAPFADLYLHSIETATEKLKATSVSMPFTDSVEFNRTINNFAGEPNGSLIVIPDAFTVARRNEIIAAAAKHRLPAIYPFRFYVADGGLMSYGPDPTDGFRQAASYVDRILKGAKAADLPVQTPTKFELVINLKTAKVLGFEVPLRLQQLADELIE